ncbi:hypothetical protein B5X24_HaOG207372 [Helicoverpa armigera]|uniref:Uncharacterized protein n=1 Tax=Helicoverpa armigera TaxID=29058 RepID=A0A2W1BSE5_HELAM|nr:hypothetical protein B5X24_HaOG207372 [Helicoverpa armigera]
MYTHLAVLSINLITCTCYVNYDLFRGFEATPTPGNHHSTLVPLIDSGQRMDNTEETAATSAITKNQLNFTSAGDEFLITPVVRRRRPKIKVKEFQLICPEDERPMAIGTYEIPTQRDLVLFTKRTLMKMFNSYHKKTLYLLKDIKEATKSTVEVEKKCHGRGKIMYKKCVKQISKKCEVITKDLVQTLEHQEAEVAALTEDKICTMASMRTDPIQLIKVLAKDEATLDFALPAFLRLLGGCTAYCTNSMPPDNRPRLRQLTDQELVVRHFLTRKTYMQLIKDTDKYV